MAEVNHFTVLLMEVVSPAIASVQKVLCFFGLVISYLISVLFTTLNVRIVILFLCRKLQAFYLSEIQLSCFCFHGDYSLKQFRLFFSRKKK